jgi:alpha-L-rhamnosidase
LWELIPSEGHADLAYRVAVNDSYPSYGFMLKNGATTLWEHWPDKSSHMHYFMGFVDNFFYRYLAGINFDTSKPGFKHIIFKPQFISAIDFVESGYLSIHGEIKAQWHRTTQGDIEYRVSIPPNCSAKVLLAKRETELTSGSYKLTIRQNDL